MKLRIGFISNSSSASFVVAKSLLSEREIHAVLAYPNNEKFYDGWDIYEDENYLRGSCICDNGSFAEYLEMMDVRSNGFIWSQ